MKKITALLLERIDRFIRIGHPKARAVAVYDLGAKVRNFAGEMAMKLSDKDDPYGELANNAPKVKSAGRKMIKALEDFSKAVFDSEAYLNIEKEKGPKVRGRLGGR